MARDLEFYFDFSSPYGYFASKLVDDVAAEAGRETVWKPIMLGSVFKKTGAQPLLAVPIKGEYSRRDWERLGRFFGVPWVLPDSFPITTLAAARAFYWLDDQDSTMARSFAKAAFHAFFGEGRDITSGEIVADLAAPMGIERADLLAAIDDSHWKQRLIEEGDKAINLGVCGSPFFIVDGEGFWGCDRLDMVKMWMLKGGW
jgi:2-hydroxychromene-2-carboxylate isomerase